MESSSSPKPFLGIRFALAGLNPIDESKLLSKLVNGGGVDVGRYTQNYTHLIIDKLVYDDPICVAARNSGKTVVLGTWVDHSFDIGIMVDPTSVLYRPPKDLNGIPGAKSLIVCLTGYQRQDRDDIMTMVALMGGQFSKPLVANKVTHLICYKFEGEKYELAKRMKRIKLVNHRWLEDCLKEWRLLPEADYEKSGYELEMMEASAKDSEDEAENNSKKTASRSPLVCKPPPMNVPFVQIEKGDSSNTKTSKDTWITPEKLGRPHGDAPLHDNRGKSSTSEDVCPDPLAKTTPVSISMAPLLQDDTSTHGAMSKQLEKSLPSTLKSTEKSPFMPLKSPGLELEFMKNATNGSDISASKSDSAAGIHGKLLETETLTILPKKRSTGGDVSSPKSLKVDCTNEASNSASRIAMETSSSVSGIRLLGSADKTPAKKMENSGDRDVGIEDEAVVEKSVERSATELAKEEGSSVADLSALGSKEKTSEIETEVLKKKNASRKYLGTRGKVKKSGNMEDEAVVEKSVERSATELAKETGSSVADLSVLGSKEKTEVLKKKSASRKTLGTRGKVKKSGNIKGSIYLSNDCTNSLSDGKASVHQTELSVPAVDSKSTPEIEKQIECGNGESNPVEEKDCPVELDKGLNIERPDETEGVIEAVEAEVNENACNDTTDSEVSREKISVENGRKPNLHTAKVEKPVLKKTRRSKQEDAEVKQKDDKSAMEGKKEMPVKRKTSQKTGGETEKTGARKGKTSTEVDKDLGKMSCIARGPACFILSGPKFQKKEFQQIIKRLKGKLCRDSHHQWCYQATHFITPEIRRTEKLFAAVSSGSWVLQSDYMADCSEAGKFLEEEPYEWHKNGLNHDGAVNLEAPRKWRLVKEKTGHGAFYGMRIVFYGDSMVPSLDTMKRAVKAGDGTILATAPPYKRFLNSDTDFAVISPGMPRVDAWVQEFIRHEIPCVLADYLVEYVCKPGYPLDKHVLYNTNAWAERSFHKLMSNAEEEEDVASPSDDISCDVCGRSDREEVMLICGDERGSKGCGIGTHIDCCDPPLTLVPEDDWFCPKCSDHTPNKRLKAKRH